MGGLRTLLDGEEFVEVMAFLFCRGRGGVSSGLGGVGRDSCRVERGGRSASPVVYFWVVMTVGVGIVGIGIGVGV